MKYVNNDVKKLIIKDPNISASDIRALCLTSEEFALFCKNHKVYIDSVIAEKPKIIEYHIPIKNENNVEVEYNKNSEYNYNPETDKFDIDNIKILSFNEKSYSKLRIYKDLIRDRTVYISGIMIENEVLFIAFSSIEEVIEYSETEIEQWRDDTMDYLSVINDTTGLEFAASNDANYTYLNYDLEQTGEYRETIGDNSINAIIFDIFI